MLEVVDKKNLTYTHLICQHIQNRLCLQCCDLSTAAANTKNKGA
mgnify:CR=1 FL=1